MKKIPLIPIGKISVCIEGDVPERALLRLKKENITVYNVEKTKKNQILLLISKKDSEKVFAIFSNVCYNIGTYTSYTITKNSEIGIAKHIAWLKNRMGAVFGAMLCAISLLACNLFVWDVDLVGTSMYQREVRAVLAEHGIKRFCVYDDSSADLITAQLLRLNGVEFCSVQKRGFYVRVELRTSPFVKLQPLHGDMTANVTGKLLTLTVLQGTPLRQAGEQVTAGEAIAGGYLQGENGEQVQTHVIARARIMCVYTQAIDAKSEEEAFAKAYLQLGLADGDEIIERTITQNGAAFDVNIVYTVLQTWNFE